MLWTPVCNLSFHSSLWESDFVVYAVVQSSLYFDPPSLPLSLHHSSSLTLPPLSLSLSFPPSLTLPPSHIPPSLLLSFPPSLPLCLLSSSSSQVSPTPPSRHWYSGDVWCAGEDGRALCPPKFRQPVSFQYAMPCISL